MIQRRSPDNGAARVCAIYARVSDESQVHGDSLDHQIAYAREYARRRASDAEEVWVVPDELVYVDEGITGLSMVKRPAVLRLLEDARHGRFDVLLCKGISRFARDTVDALTMLRSLIACGVQVISIEENFDSHRDRAEFVFTIHSALAQAESEKTSVRVRLGAMQKARSGRWNGRPPDGYRLNRETQRLEIDDEQALVIRQIFAMYLAGFGCRAIAERLNQQGIVTANGKLWSQRRIARILQNPVYCGEIVYGRRTKRMRFRQGSRASSNAVRIGCTMTPKLCMCPKHIRLWSIATCLQRLRIACRSAVCSAGVMEVCTCWWGWRAARAEGGL
ncbi:hypothetical protein GCM10025858_09590 [Alicyclobacillus sacchari]|uniref:recombinase family protein n=1 Tax=Alicyclobacillus sacchari TaxID=392010 RepID=UPI0023E95B65|nr:recombinase family protein [Alicyclobacillus sacchari]GMA56456.1 hypothetical protein GCM10025858_09590 [Alicyclobacillus sacchari]